MVHGTNEGEQQQRQATQESGGLPMILASLAFSTRKFLLRRVLLMSTGTPSTRSPLSGLYTTQSDLQ